MVNWREKAQLRPRELADVASVSLRTIRRKIERGEIESRLVDGCRVIPIREALRFVGEDSEPAPSGPVLAVGPEAREFASRIRRESV